MGGEGQKSESQSNFGSNFQNADFMVTVTAATFEEKPRNKWEVIMPFERFVAMEANGAARQFAMVQFPGPKTTSLTAEEGAEGGAENKHQGQKSDLHNTILA